MVKEQIMQHTTDVGAIGILGLVWANVLPTIASLFTVIWIGIKIYETDTVMKLRGKKKTKKRK